MPIMMSGDACDWREIVPIATPLSAALKHVARSKCSERHMLCSVCALCACAVPWLRACYARWRPLSHAPFRPFTPPLLSHSLGASQLSSHLARHGGAPRALPFRLQLPFGGAVGHP
eukprot:scaffold221432_cov41-Tisochrysis_lutea.AAC.2